MDRQARVRKALIEPLENATLHCEVGVTLGAVYCTDGRARLIACRPQKAKARYSALLTVQVLPTKLRRISAMDPFRAALW
jgi:hypothetical protein